MLLCSKKMPDTKKRAPTNALRTKMVHRWLLCTAKEDLVKHNQPESSVNANIVLHMRGSQDLKHWLATFRS
jgi:hypothetical protein